MFYLRTDLSCPWIKVLSRLKAQIESCEVLQRHVYSFLMTNVKLFELFGISDKCTGVNSVKMLFS